MSAYIHYKLRYQFAVAIIETQVLSYCHESDQALKNRGA